MVLDDLIRHDSHSQCQRLHVDLDEGYSEDDLCQIFNELRQNTTVEKVYISTEWADDARLGVKACLSLAAAIAKHPAITSLAFCSVQSIENFGAIVVAIQQNKNLTCFVLYSCRLSPAQMGALEWLLAENGVEDIEIDSCYPSNDVLCIAQGLRSNQSLKKLCIEHVGGGEDVLWSVSRATVDAVADLLRGNKIIQSVDLHFLEVPPESVLRIAEAATGHASLTKLSLHGIGDAGTSALPRLLEANTGIKTMDLGGNNLSNDGAVALSSTLKSNTSIEVLSLVRAEIGAKGTSALAGALHDNTILKEINMVGNPIGDDGAVALAEALTSNTSLTLLNISHSGKDGLDAFASRLPSMNGIKKLRFHYLNGLTLESTTAFLKGLERNTELEKVIIMNIENDPDTERLVKEMMPKVKLQMALNRAGKRILKSESHVPDGLWPLILERSSTNPDALYFFLREKPDLLMNRPSPVRLSRKRKRGWFGGWF